MLLKDIDSDDLIDVYLIGCTGIFPAIILGFLDAIFDFNFDELILLIIILLIWYSLIILLWFTCKKENKNEI